MGLGGAFQLNLKRDMRWIEGDVIVKPGDFNFLSFCRFWILGYNWRTDLVQIELVARNKFSGVLREAGIHLYYIFDIMLDECND